MLNAIPVALFVVTAGPNDVVAVGAHDGWGANGAITYAADGSRFAVESNGGPIVFDAKTGRIVRELHVSPSCDHVALSTHGDRMACGGRIVDVANGSIVDEQSDGLARSSDGKIVLATTQLGVVLVAHGQRVALHVEPAPDPRLTRLPPEFRAAVAGHLRPVHEAWLTPDAAYALVRGGDGVSIFRTKDGSLVGTVAKDFATRALAIGGHKVAIPAPSAIVIFDVARAREEKRIPIERYAGKMAMTPDGATLVLADSNTVSIVDVPSGEMLRTLTLKGVNPDNIGVAPGGKIVVVTGYNDAVRRFDVVSGKELAIDDRHATSVTSAALAPDGDRFATVAGDGVRVWRHDGTLLHFEPAIGGSVAMPDAHHVVVVGASAAVLSDDGGAWTLRGATGEACCSRAIVAADGKTAWLRGSGGDLDRIDVATGAVLEHAKSRISYAEAFDADDGGRPIVGGSVGGSVGGGAPVAAFAFGPASSMHKIDVDSGAQYVSSVRVSGDGAWLLVNDGRNGFVVGSTSTGHTRALPGTSAMFVAHAPLLAVVQGDELRVVRPDGTIVATSSGAQSRQLLAADAKRVALSDNDGRVVVMSLPEAKSR